MTGGSEFKSGWVDISPDTIDHLFGIIFGGAGKTYGRIASLPMALLRGDLEKKDIPFVRRLSADPDPFVDQTDYFRRKQIVQNTVAEYKSFEGALQRGRKKDFRDRYGEILRMETRMKNSDKQLKRLRERRRHQENKIPKDSADALDIADRIEKIEDQMDSVYKRFNKRYNEKVGRFD